MKCILKTTHLDLLSGKQHIWRWKSRKVKKGLFLSMYLDVNRFVLGCLGSKEKESFKFSLVEKFGKEVERVNRIQIGVES